MKKLVLFGLLILSIVLSPFDVYASNKKEVIFSDCVDGDTAKFILDGEVITARFLAIDTPETVHPTQEEEPFGKEASKYTCEKLEKAKKIELEYDNGGKTDKYDRHLVWVYADGMLIQRELIKLGYAEVAYIYDDYKYTEELEVLQDYAKKSKVGIWSEYEEKTTHPLIYVLIVIVVILIFWKGSASSKRKLKNKIKKTLEKELKLK